MTWKGAGKDEPAVGIFGLGYVGLPLALQFARGGCIVCGFDVDQDKIASITRGQSYIEYIPHDDITDHVNAGRLVATSNYALAAEQDALVICLPTPLDAHRVPDLSYVLDTARDVAPYLRAGQLVSLESTTYPGTTDEDLKPVLEDGSGLKAGLDFHLAYSPEREDPGNRQFRTADIPKVVAGLTPDCLEAALDLYRRAVKTLVPVSDTKVAEATKLVENIFRSVNIAMVNELKIVFDRMGIDIWEVIEAAKTKPFGFMPFYPGPGLGGHCIPLDPFFLSWRARRVGVDTKFIELAGEVNTSMPRYVVGRLMEALSDRGKPLKDARILLVGLAFKQNVDDPRESPSFELWELLEARGAHVEYHDPYIPVAPSMRNYPDYAGRRSVELTPEVLAGCDAVLIATAHDKVDYEHIVRHAELVVDTRNVCARLPAGLTAGKVIKA